MTRIALLLALALPLLSGCGWYLGMRMMCYPDTLLECAAPEGAVQKSRLTPTLEHR